MYLKLVGNLFKEKNDVSAKLSQSFTNFKTLKKFFMNHELKTVFFKKEINKKFDILR